jgi:hypothetical protein
LIGSAVFFCFAIYLFASEARSRADDRASTFLLMLLAGFGATALVHDLLYQRAFWLLLGAALAFRRDQLSGSARENMRDVDAGSTPQAANTI